MTARPTSQALEVAEHLDLMADYAEETTIDNAVTPADLRSAASLLRRMDDKDEGIRDALDILTGWSRPRPDAEKVADAIAVLNATLRAALDTPAPRETEEATNG